MEQAPFPGPPPPAPAQGPPNDGTGALVCGILSILMASMCGVGLILGAVGIKLSNPGPGRVRVGSAQAGFICSVIGMILGSFSLLIGIVYVVFIGAAIGTVAGVADEMAEIEAEREALRAEGEQLAADGHIRIEDARLETTGPEGGRTRTVLFGRIVNDSQHAVERVVIEVRFAGGQVFEHEVEIYVPPTSDRRTIPRRVILPPGADPSRPTQIVVVRAALVYRPEPRSP